MSQHGESEYNVLGKIGGDAVLSARGERYAQALASQINAMHISDLRVLTSRLRRTIATARGVMAPQEHVASLNELNAGVCEGLSYEEMQEQYPQVRKKAFNPILYNPNFFRLLVKNFDGLFYAFCSIIPLLSQVSVLKTWYE